MGLLSGFIVLFVISEVDLSVTISGPLKTIENAADDTVASVAKGVIDQVRKVINISATVNQKVHDDTILGKVRNGVYDIKKGIVTGADEVVGTPVNLKEVSFYLVTSENLERSQKIDFFKPENVARTKGKIIFLIHGWTSSMNISWYYDLSKIFVTKDPRTHMVQVDWHKPADDFYPFSAFDIESVGNYVGILINRLVVNYGVSHENILLIGHSLGAHISGFASKLFTEITGLKLPRIIALDTAGPLFILRPNSIRLNSTDAKVVMAIHTDAGAFGYPTTIGTIDFFPNGGANQPGCWRKLKAIDLTTYSKPVTCDHTRSWKYFVAAVNVTGSFPARKCKSYKNYENGQCKGEVVMMGDVKTEATGSFYLDTNSKEPFSRPLK